MKNYNRLVKINHNSSSPYVPDYNCMFLIICDSGLGKTNVLLNQVKHQRPYIDNIYFHVQDPFKSKYQLLINGRKKVGIKKLKNSNAFIDYSQIIDYVYENLEDYNPAKKRELQQTALNHTSGNDFRHLIKFSRAH